MLPGIKSDDFMPSLFQSKSKIASLFQNSISRIADGKLCGQ